MSYQDRAADDRHAIGDGWPCPMEGPHTVNNEMGKSE